MAASEKAKQRRLIQQYLHGSRSSVVWEIAHIMISDLFGERRAILDEYIRTEGNTDWVWLEENLSFQLNENTQLEANTDAEEFAAYFAGFAIVTSVIRAEFPKVMPPMWFTRDVLPVLHNTKVVPKELGELARDAFLSGRDQEAIEILRPIEEGPFIFRMSGFLEDPDINPHRALARVTPSLPPGSTFEVKSLTTDDYYISSSTTAEAAIGACMLRFVHAPLQTWVVAIVTGDSDNVWNGDIIFAISNDAADIEEIAAANG